MVVLVTSVVSGEWRVESKVTLYSDGRRGEFSFALLQFGCAAFTFQVILVSRISRKLYL